MFFKYKIILELDKISLISVVFYDSQILSGHLIHSNIDSVALEVHNFSADSQNLYSFDFEAYIHFRYLCQINLPN